VFASSSTTGGPDREFRVPRDGAKGQICSSYECGPGGDAAHVFLSISGDGTKVDYLSNKARGNGLWMSNLQTRLDLAVARYPRINRDGTMLAFLEGQVLFVMPSSGGEAKAVCGDCGRPWDGSPDGTRICLCRARIRECCGRVDHRPGRNAFCSGTIRAISPTLSSPPTAAGSASTRFADSHKGRY
jgi:hypothetical protein